MNKNKRQRDVDKMKQRMQDLFSGKIIKEVVEYLNYGRR